MPCNQTFNFAPRFTLGASTDKALCATSSLNGLESLFCSKYEKINKQTTGNNIYTYLHHIITIPWLPTPDRNRLRLFEQVTAQALLRSMYLPHRPLLVTARGNVAMFKKMHSLLCKRAWRAQWQCGLSSSFYDVLWYSMCKDMIFNV